MKINFNEFWWRKVTCKTKNFYILLVFLLTTIAFLIAVIIYYYFRKYKSKQKYLLPYYVTNDKLKTVYINKCFIKMESKDILKFKLILKMVCVIILMT